MPQPQRKRLLKDSNGCVACRRRKVKCDGRENGCINCERLGFQCSFAPTASTYFPDAEAIHRRRALQACEACRKNKLRCSGGLPRCERCESKSIGCVYRDELSRRRKTVRKLPHPTTPDTSCDVQAAITDPSCRSPIQDVNVSKIVIQQHIEAFFQYVHIVGPFNYIHRGSFMRTWHMGKMAKSLLIAVVGVASRFLNLAADSQDAASTPFPRSLLDEVERETLCDIRHSTIPKLQIILLLLYDRNMSGDLSAVWNLAALAARNAYGLQLNNPIDVIPFTNQECRRRLMWCVYIMDKLSTGPSYPNLCSRETMRVQLPCDSRSFDLEFECKNPSLEEFSRSIDSFSNISTVGVTSYLIRVLDMRDQIKRYLDNKKRSPANDPSHWENDPNFLSFQQELSAFCEGLPPDMQDSQRATYIRANTPDSDVYIMVQAWLRASWCELIREAMACVDLPQSQFIESHVAQLLGQALRLSQFFQHMSDVQSPSRKLFVGDWGIAPCMMEMTKALLYGAEKAPTICTHDSIISALALNLKILDSLAELSRCIASWRDGIVSLISKSSYAELVNHRIPRPAGRSLVPENVLAEARQAENARFPRDAAFRKTNPAVIGSNHMAPQSQLDGPDIFGEQPIDASLGASDGLMVGAGSESLLGLGGNDTSNWAFDMDAFYAEDVNGQAWNFPFGLDNM